MDEEEKPRTDHLKKRTVRTAMIMLPKDVELLTYLSEYLGCSRADAMRTSLRHFAAHIGFLESRQR